VRAWFGGIGWKLTEVFLFCRSNKTKGHIVRTLAAVIRMLWSGECKHISSKHLKAVIGEQDSLFYGTDQQDSHEFLIMLIDWLQSDLQTIPVVSLSGSSWDF
jgi:ubiquitin C-terminal hydrolase